MSNGNQKKWVTDLIGDEYKQWKNDFIFFGIGTGRGKTKFSLEVYCPWLIESGAKNILYLCNRSKLKEQVDKRVEKIIKENKSVGELSDKRILSEDIFQESLNEETAEHVTVQIYQWLIFMLNHRYELPKYDAILVDEAHFLLSDASFVDCTDMVYEYIMHQNCPILFMTATYKITFEWIQQDIINRGLTRRQWKYFLDTDYSYVDKIVWFDQKHLYGIIDSILRDTDDKFVYFINGVSKMMRFYQHYNPDSDRMAKKYEVYLRDSFSQYIDFQCSKHTNSDDGQRINEKYPNVFTEGEDGGYTIVNRGLVATKFIDNGIDLKDHKIKHIICDILDPETAIQCLGRKRILDDDDRCTFYIRHYRKTSMNVFVGNAEEKLASPELFLSNRKEWLRINDVERGFNDKVIYKDCATGEYRLNRLRYDKLRWDLQFLTDLQNEVIDYKEFIVDYLGSTAKRVCEDAKFYQMERVHSVLGFFLEDHKGEILNKTQQGDLIDLCCLKDKYGRLQKSIGMISRYIEENHGYVLEAVRYKFHGKKITGWKMIPVRPP